MQFDAVSYKKSQLKTFAIIFLFHSLHALFELNLNHRSALFFKILYFKLEKLHYKKLFITSVKLMSHFMYDFTINFFLGQKNTTYL
jgi:hypothetical protein